jgi:MFS family permease
VKHAYLNILTLIITYFLWGFVNFIYIIQIQPYILSLYAGTGDEAAQVLGFILSIGSFSAVLPVLLGFCADRYGRKLFIILGELLSLFGLLGLSLANPHILISIISIIFFNAGIGIHDPPLNALIYESSNKKRRGLAYSAIYNSSSIAGIIASLLIQTDGNNYLLFFQAGCLLFIILLLMNFILLKDIKSNIQKIKFPLTKILKEPISRLTAIAFAIDSFSWGLPLSIANGIYILLFEVDVSFIANLTLFQTIFLVLLQYPAGFTVDHWGRIIGLVIGEIFGIFWIFCVQMAIINPGNVQELLLLGYAFLGISIAFWRPSVTLSFISLDPSVASSNFGILSFIQRLGWVPTAAIGGLIFSLFGFSPLLIVTFVGTLIVICFFYKIDQLGKLTDLN